MKRQLCTIILGAALSLWSLDASAGGVLAAPADLPPAARAVLIGEVAQARQADPDSFAQLKQLRGDLVALDGNKRGRLASVTPALRGLGPRGLLPMLAEIAVDANGQGAMTDTAWRAWRIDLLEAVGALRDVRSRAVLEAVLAGPSADLMLLRAAAEALGKLGDDAAAAKLIALSKAPGRKGLAVLAGMGHCRREAVATRLAEAMASVGDAREASLVARALGDVGNAWAWQTPAARRSGEEAAVRGIAAQSLINAFVALGHAEIRESLTKAILVVDEPATPLLIAAAQAGVDADSRAALDALAKRFDQSPLH
jgi:hypothetical protein